MKIYTRNGDAGFSRISPEITLPKNHPAFEFLGELDELQIRIGSIFSFNVSVRSARERVIHESFPPENMEKFREELFFLEKIQKMNYTISSWAYRVLAQKNLAKEDSLPEEIRQIIAELESRMDAMDGVLEPLRDFILANGDSLSNIAHLARTQSRKSERVFLTWVFHDHLETETTANATIRYLNRLSDYFFVLARWIAYLGGHSDITYKD